MGQADTATARYLRRNEIFADMFNFFLYNGEEVIEPAAISGDVFENFHSTLKEVLEFIKYSADPDKLMNVVDADEAFQHLGRTEMGVLKACVNKNLPAEQDKEEEGTTNMKDAITILEERAAEEAKVATVLQNIKGLMKTMGLTAEQAMDAMQISDCDRAAILERL